MIRILRLTGASPLLTAEVFEQLFERHLGAEFEVARASLHRFHAQVLGPCHAPFELPEAAGCFREATAKIDFLCPSWEAIPFAPLMLALRNLSGAPVRLLLVAHAAGIYLWEWTMLRPLLRPGDVIVAPSPSARATIELLSPELSPFLRVICHPMSPLPRGPAPSRPRLVSLGRLVPPKLVHRQIEAMAVLRDRGQRLPVMQIAGPLDGDPSWPGVTPYCRGLQQKIARLGLEPQVELVGSIRGDEAKGAFLSSASMLVNLSITLEESFPKTPVEALGVGVPVLGTSWNGLRDTVGVCGDLLPLDIVGADAERLDVSAAAVADGIERLLDRRPSAADCSAWAEQFRPERAVPRYRAALEEAMQEAVDHRRQSRDCAPLPGADLPAAPAEGLLARAVPLTHHGWRELFDHFVTGMRRTRVIREGNAPPPPTPWDQLSPLLPLATRAPLERFFARLPPPRAGGSGASAPIPGGAPPDALGERLFAMATSTALPDGRLACLGELARVGRRDLLLAGLQTLERDGLGGVRVNALRADALAADGDLPAAFARCVRDLEVSPPTEDEAHRVRQVAAIARAWSRPALALPSLVEWLERFPDAAESGPAWLDLAMTALRAGPSHGARAARALTRARALLGEIPVVRRADSLLTAGRARSTFA